MSAIYTVFTSPNHAPIPDHLPTLIVTPNGQPQTILYSYLHTNYNKENYLLTPSPNGDLCVAKLFPPAPGSSGRSSEGHGSGSSNKAVRCEASRNLKWTITNTGVVSPSYKLTLPSIDPSADPSHARNPASDPSEQPLFQISKPNPNSPYWTLFYFTYAGFLIPPKRVEFGRIQKNESVTGPNGQRTGGGGTRITITGKTEEEKAVWKTLGDGNEDMVEWIVLCAALQVLDDEIVKAAEKAGVKPGALGPSGGGGHGRSGNQTARHQLHPTGSGRSYALQRAFGGPGQGPGPGQVPGPMMGGNNIPAPLASPGFRAPSPARPGPPISNGSHHPHPHPQQQQRSMTAPAAPIMDPRDPRYRQQQYPQQQQQQKPSGSASVPPPSPRRPTHQQPPLSPLGPPPQPQHQNSLPYPGDPRAMAAQSRQHGGPTDPRYGGGGGPSGSSASLNGHDGQVYDARYAAEMAARRLDPRLRSNSSAGGGNGNGNGNPRRAETGSSSSHDHHQNQQYQTYQTGPSSSSRTSHGEDPSTLTSDPSSSSANNRAPSSYRPGGGYASRFHNAQQVVRQREASSSAVVEGGGSTDPNLREGGGGGRDPLTPLRTKFEGISLSDGDGRFDASRDRAYSNASSNGGGGPFSAGSGSGGGGGRPAGDRPPWDVGNVSPTRADRAGREAMKDGYQSRGVEQPKKAGVLRKERR